MKFQAAGLALVVLTGGFSGLAEVRADQGGADVQPAPEEQLDPAAEDQAMPQLQPPPELPLAPSLKGERPRLNAEQSESTSVEFAPRYPDLAAPESLALPDSPQQVRILEMQPISLIDAENLAEANNPNLKAIASQVDQAQSNLRAQMAIWYPSIDLQARAVPGYTSADSRTRTNSGLVTNTSNDRWAVGANVTAQWSLINPTRTPTVAAARDQFERSRYQYLIALRDLRLQVAEAYFDLQQADDGVRIGQESVRASLVSLRDARARFQAGVATKLEVLEAETQLARDQQVLTEFLASQSIARRALASLLALPQTVTPTAKDPARVLGVWQPSLQESVVAAYGYREELNQALLDISIANSNANTALGSVQPFLNVFAAFGVDYQDPAGGGPFSSDTQSSSDTAVGLSLSWRLFDGGQARAQYRQQKQRAAEGAYRFAQSRDLIRLQVEESFYELEKNNRNIATTSREVISARESLRLARLRFQAGVTTQREVVDNQRDLTRAEVSYSNAITNYNKRLAQLRRRTGLDQVLACPPQSLPAAKPAEETPIPIEPTPLIPACQAAVGGPG